MPDLQKCKHCGEIFTKKDVDFCPRCETPEKRQKLDEENIKIREELKKKGWLS